MSLDKDALDRAVEEITEFNKRQALIKEQEEWAEFFMFLHNMFDDSPHCCNQRSCDFFKKMMNKIKEEVKNAPQN